MAGTDRLQAANTSFLQLIVIALGPYKTGAGRLAEGNSKAGLRNRGGNNLVQILGGFDKVRLPDYDVAPFGILDPDSMYFQVHVILLFRFVYFKHISEIVTVNYFGVVAVNGKNHSVL
jgi:hypothetical protein